MNGTVGKNKLFILTLVTASVFLMAGCGTGAFADVTNPGTSEPVVPPVIEQSEQTPVPTAAPEQPAEQPQQSADTPQEAYRPIIDAYIHAQSNGFTSFAPIIKDTFLATARDLGPDMAGVGVDIAEISLYYAPRDINKDRIPELFIIAADSYGDYVWGVYTIADHAPRSLFQKANARDELRLHHNEDGESVLVLSWSHMGEAVDLFYRLPEGGTNLVLAEGLYTDWNAAAQNDEYAGLENHEIIRYGDHYKSATNLYPTPDALTPISIDEWEAIWAGFSAKADDFSDMLSLSDYPTGF